MENKMEYIMAQQTEMCHSCPASECGVNSSRNPVFLAFLIKRNFFWTAFMEKRQPDLRTRTDLLRKLLFSRCYWL